MLRKRVITKPSQAPILIEGSIPIADVAVVEVTSEQPHHPIDHAFDSSRGPGGTRWIADALGTQFVVAKAHARALIVAGATLAHGLMAAGLQGVIDQTWPRLAWTAMLEQIVINTVVAWVVFAATESLPGALARNRARSRSSWGRRQW